MNHQELNAYIYNYCKNDLSSSALLLTGPSGSGKSHYLRTVLAPYLNDTPEQFSCILISLQDIADPEQLSREIFLENRARALKPKSEKRAVGTILAKTVVKSIGSYLNLDLTADEEDKDNLYKSVNLTGKLIAFEDIESSPIDRNAFCDYVASLANKDRVKILLVINDRTEAELIRDITEKIPTSIVRYKVDFPSVVRGVFAEYDHPVLNGLATEETIREMREYSQLYRSANIHALFDACQKTVDIYRLMKTDTVAYDPDFLKSVFMGNLLFLGRRKMGQDVSWDDEDQLSFRLGGGSYPLFRFCYTFITEGVFEAAQVIKAQEVLREFRAYDRQTRPSDPDLAVLYSWYYQTDKDLTEAVDRITERLKDPNAFALQEYGRIASCMLEAEALLHCDISAAKQLLVSNLTAEGMNVNPDFISRYLVPSGNDPEAVTACSDLKKRMLDALKKVDTRFFGFSYQPDEIERFSQTVSDIRERILKFGAFARALDNERIVEMLKHCTAKQLYDFRTAYSSTYKTPDIRVYLSGDRSSVCDLSARLKELESCEGYDRIWKKNLRDFILDLERIAGGLQDR